ncbi:MAG: hypothetical protein E7186_01265 [Erysipelotrichaceae bacterium]|nr:hypothetical protein [Erysipelotrichaceae bacterium]
MVENYPGEKLLKKALKTVLIVLLSIFMVVSDSACIKAEETEAAEGFVLGEGIRVRLGPGVNYEHLTINGSYQYYNDGEVLSIIGSSVNNEGELWYNVIFNRDKEYRTWVRDEYFQLIVNKPKDAAFEAYMNDQGFPDTYKRSIRRLHNLYPNWTFVAYHTNLDWNEAVSQESRLGFSLVDGSDTSLRSKDPGAYDSSTGQYIPWDGNNWFCANSETVAYYMDPRNFINKMNIFMFLNLGYKESETAEVIQKVLDGTFMSGNAPVDNRRYADLFFEGGRNNRISGLYLAVLARLEQGTNGSAATSGAAFSYNGRTYSGLYNYFNIGAVSDAENWKLGLIYANGGVNGTETSYNRPWNSPSRAINGGAEWIAEGYISDGQDTMYLMKFNVTPVWTYSHQYMTNIRGVYIKSESMFFTYYDTGNLTRDLTFSIPVYENMPEYTVLPGHNPPVIIPEDPVEEPEISEYDDPAADVSSGDIITDLCLINDNETLTGFETGTTAGVISNLASSMENGTQVTIRNASGETVEGNSLIATGYTVEIRNGDNVEDYTVIIKGDVNGDGKIDAADLLEVKKDILNLSELEGPYLKAALPQGEEEVSILSYIMIKRHLLGTEEIDQQEH